MSVKRVVLHAHSNWSYDGSWTLPAIARLYGACGVDVVMMTEHDTGFKPERFDEYREQCASASTRRCKIVPGIEYSCPDNDIHILTWGLDEFLAEHRPVDETLSKVRDHGGAAIFAHPIRRDAWRKFDPNWVDRLSGIEIWNRKSDGVLWGQEAADLITQTGLPATVGQDFHKLRHLYPLTMAMEAGQDDLEAGLVHALRAGTATPQAFRRALLDSEGQPYAQPHTRLENARRTLRDLVRR